MFGIFLPCLSSNVEHSDYVCHHCGWFQVKVAVDGLFRRHDRLRFSRNIPTND